MNHRVFARIPGTEMRCFWLDISEQTGSSRSAGSPKALQAEGWKVEQRAAGVEKSLGHLETYRAIDQLHLEPALALDFPVT